jgi:hypothetical protein
MGQQRRRTVFVQMFDAALASWVGAPPAPASFRDLRQRSGARAQRRSVPGDHFVEPKHLLGNIRSVHKCWNS